jgi:hypothetical protein
LQELLELRKEYPVLSKGKMKHIYPGDEIYLIIKELKGESVLIIVNAGEKDTPVLTSHLKIFIPKVMKLKNLKSYLEIDLNADEMLYVKKTSAQIFLVSDQN